MFFLYLDIVKYHLGLHRNVRFLANICYTVVLFIGMSRLSSYIVTNRISFRC